MVDYGFLSMRGDLLLHDKDGRKRSQMLRKKPYPLSRMGILKKKTHATIIMFKYSTTLSRFWRKEAGNTFHTTFVNLAQFLLCLSLFALLNKTKNREGRKDIVY